LFQAEIINVAGFLLYFEEARPVSAGVVVALAAEHYAVAVIVAALPAERFVVAEIAAVLPAERFVVAEIAAV
jgi:hypothetical protein